ncbi:MAG: hypothetical protein HY343_02605 [Lentisphaerae bacterium]|nr:hypothetical protein [Lentisphaerota bacterium]
MKFTSFHSPAFSATVLRRQVGADLVDLLAALGEIMLTRGRALLWHRSVRCRTAYYRAAHRLRSAGLLVHRRSPNHFPVLALTLKGETRVSDTIFPERFWRRRWSGRWSVLMYDIPERERGYRQALQKFLQRQRMGCLQRSVWISPFDVRPLFDDLREAAEVDAYAVLFEARNVLGQKDADLAALA